MKFVAFLILLVGTAAGLYLLTPMGEGVRGALGGITRTTQKAGRTACLMHCRRSARRAFACAVRVKRSRSLLLRLIPEARLIKEAWAERRAEIFGHADKLCEGGVIKALHSGATCRRSWREARSAAGCRQLGDKVLTLSATK